MTSQSLVEHDIYLGSRASTEMLIGELMRRFGYVMLDENVMEYIAPIGEPFAKRGLPPRVFALGSAGSSRSFPEIELRDLCWQRELVFSSFGKPILRPLLIATGTDNISAKVIRNQGCEKTNFLFLKTQAIALG